MLATKSFLSFFRKNEANKKPAFSRELAACFRPSPSPFPAESSALFESESARQRRSTVCPVLAQAEEFRYVPRSSADASPPQPRPLLLGPCWVRTLRVLAEAPPGDVAHLLQELLPNPFRVSLPAAKIHERLGSSCKAFLAGFKIATLRRNSNAQVRKNLSTQAGPWENGLAVTGTMAGHTEQVRV